MRHINEELFNECYGKIKKNFILNCNIKLN